MKSREVIVEAPASSANLGPGFDVLALALANPVDRLAIRRDDDAKPGLRLALEEGPSTPAELADNSAGAVALKIAKDHGIKSGVTMALQKGVPVGVGLGSSAASSVCAVIGMNECFDLRLSATEAIDYAVVGEETASGARHFDNVAAALLGGVVVVRSAGEVDVTRIGSPKGLGLCVVTPKLALPKKKTEFARSLIPKSVNLQDVTRNVSMAASLVLGFQAGNAGLVGKGMHDFIVEPSRASMIPGIEKVRARALEGGASGVCISGAGPTMLAVFDSEKSEGSVILKAMISGFKEAGVTATGFESRIGGGARVVRPE
jgi:homoserine kinase